MAFLYITEYATGGLAQVGGTVMQVPHEPPLASQVIDITIGSEQSAAFNAATTLIRLHCDATCSVLFGADPTAAVTDGRMVANQTEFRNVPKGQSYKVAVIENT